MNKYILLSKHRLHFIILYLLLYCLCAQAFEYQKSTLPNENETLTGISREEAINKFGTPAMINENLWYYDYPRHFYIRFPATPSISKFFIIPYYYSINEGFPFEIKAFVTYDNLKTADVTSYVRWSIADKNIIRRKGNSFFPLKEGKTEIFALYKGLISSPSHIYVKPAKKDNKIEEILLSINIFPHNPNAHQNSSIEFSAFGTFLNAKRMMVYVEDISSKVKWFVSKKGKIRENGGQTVYTYSKEIIYVFCEYKGIKSPTQKVSVQDNTYELKNRLKNIYLIPQILTADEGTTVIMKAIATYLNNRIEDVTGSLLWKIDNTAAATLIDKGQLKLKKEGITKVEGVLFNTDSFSSKIIVKKRIKPTEKESSKIKKESTVKKETINDILKNTEDMIYKLSTEKKNIKSLNITPLSKTISLGEKINFKAAAVYNDGTKTDVTNFVKWKSSNPDKVSIEKGKVTALLSGETDIKAYLGKIASNASHIIIKPPSLISISLNQENVKLHWRKTISIKATGHYTDKNTKDITALVIWHINNKNVLDEKSKGVFLAKKPGSAEVYCEHSGIKSLPVKVSVFIPPSMILKVSLLCVIILLAAAFCILYAATQAEAIKLKNIYKDSPRDAIKKLYLNARKVLNIFGLSDKNTMPPYAYAKTINNIFFIKSNIFFKLAQKFSEAEYSKHTITQSDAIAFVEIYNKGMEEIKKNSTKFFMRYILLLLHRVPFTV